ncbi:cell division protein FtsA, partial [Thiotrichales bacterium HSG1]|nr:cell division protein FtsA [Thiotrichales bacterium HSG1]
NQEGIREPIGMSGVRLEAKVHMVTGAGSASQNIVKCIGLCDLSVDEIILEQLAASAAVLTEDEKDLGVCLVDIGGGTTDIAIFTEGSIRHTAVIPIAGDQVTNDIAVAMRTPTQYAEDIKIKYACALAKLTNSEEMIEVPSVGARPPRLLARQTLADVVEPRYAELLNLVQAVLRRSGYEDLIAAGVVLVGGSAKMDGVVELAESVFHAPVRIGFPKRVLGLTDIINDPIYATGVGLILFNSQNQYGSERRSEIINPSGNIKNVLGSMTRWFKGNF